MRFSVETERYVTNLVFERYFLLPRSLRTLLLEPLLAKLPSVGPLYKASRYIRRANMRNPKRFFSYNLLAETDPVEIFHPEYFAQLDTNCFIDLARSHISRRSKKRINIVIPPLLD